MTTYQRPRWLAPAALALSVIGLLVSAYLTYEHYSGSTSLVCSDSGAVDCLKVTTSTYSTLLGVPVALLGLLFYIAMTALCLPGMWGNRSLDYVRWAMLGAGMLFVLYLIWAEFQVGAICLWCTGVHVTTFVLLLVVLIGEAFTHEVRTRP